MSNTTIQQPISGPNLLQVEDFYQSASILHPLVIGTIILAILFAYLRLSSNRSVAPMTLFDQIVSVAMGSTVAGVVNGTALVRGIIALAVLLFWQYATSFISMHYEPGLLARTLTAPALIIAYRGKALEKFMHKHRVSKQDLNSALRARGIWNICEVEVVAIEPNGTFSIFLKKEYPTEYEPEVLWMLDGYRALRDHDDSCQDCSNKNAAGEDGEDRVLKTCRNGGA